MCVDEEPPDCWPHAPRSTVDRGLGDATEPDPPLSRSSDAGGAASEARTRGVPRQGASTAPMRARRAPCCHSSWAGSIRGARQFVRWQPPGSSPLRLPDVRREVWPYRCGRRNWTWARRSSAPLRDARLRRLAARRLQRPCLVLQPHFVRLGGVVGSGPNPQPRVSSQSRKNRRPPRRRFGAAAAGSSIVADSGGPSRDASVVR
jgi:hypothetical protein